MNVRKRLDDLEAAAGGGGRCPRCGWFPDGAKLDRERVRFQILLPGDPGYDEEPEPCPVCGNRPRRFTISLDRKG